MHFGKLHFAKHVLERLLQEPLAPTQIVPVLVQISRCWQWLGGYEPALAFLERAQAHLTSQSHPLNRAHVFHQRASLMSQLKRLDEADQALDKAMKEYRRAKNDVGYCLGLGSRVRIRFDQDRPEDALRVAQAGRIYAQRHGFERPYVNFIVDEAKAEFLLGREPACLRLLGLALAETPPDDSNVLFYVHYYYWRVYDRRGDVGRARQELEATSRHMKATDFVAEEMIHFRQHLGVGKGGKGKPGKQST